MHALYAATVARSWKVGLFWKQKVPKTWRCLSHWYNRKNLSEPSEGGFCNSSLRDILAKKKNDCMSAFFHPAQKSGPSVIHTLEMNCCSHRNTTKLQVCNCRLAQHWCMSMHSFSGSPRRPFVTHRCWHNGRAKAAACSHNLPVQIRAAVLRVLGLKSVRFHSALPLRGDEAWKGFRGTPRTRSRHVCPRTALKAWSPRTGGARPTAPSTQLFGLAGPAGSAVGVTETDRVSHGSSGGRGVGTTHQPRKCLPSSADRAFQRRTAESGPELGRARLGVNSLSNTSADVTQKNSAAPQIVQKICALSGCRGILHPSLCYESVFKLLQTYRARKLQVCYIWRFHNSLVLYVHLHVASLTV